MILPEIRKRRSVRDYLSETVTEEQIHTLIKAAQFAPTARNNRAVEFIIIKDPGIKAKIFEIVGQTFVKDAPVLILPVVDRSKSVVPIQDLSIASATIFYQAAAMGLGTIWKNLREEWIKPVKNLLRIPETLAVINLIPVGYAQTPLAGHSDEEFQLSKIHLDGW